MQVSQVFPCNGPLQSVPSASVSTYPFDQWLVPLQIVAFASVSSLGSNNAAAIQVAVPIQLTMKYQVNIIFLRIQSIQSNDYIYASRSVLPFDHWPETIYPTIVCHNIMDGST